jgi:hypothetical protein
MKPGDLVQMKYISFWMKKNHRNDSPYTELPLTVVEVVANSIWVMYPDSVLRRDLAEYYEVISESR